MLQFGLRLGRHPRCLVATTPRPTKLIRELLARAGRDVVVTRGSTYENREHLAAGFFDQIIRKYEGTRLGRQELNAELLEDTPGALWSHAIIDATRQAAVPPLARIVVAIDPAVTSGEDADETGIIVVGKDHQDHGYVLADASGKHQPIEWARIAVAAYRAHHADRIVAERNNGGAMVEATTRTVDRNVPVTTVWASRGKAARAEPVSALYEQGRVHHIGTFSKLEDQMCAFTLGFRPSSGRLLAGPPRCAGMGVDRAFGRADAELRHLRVHTAARRGDPKPAHHRHSRTLSMRSAASNGNASKSRPGGDRS